VKPKTAELLYLLLWSAETLIRPTFRNLTDSFESWAYRSGLQRQLARLERLQLVESRLGPGDTRLVRLTEQGRLHALGGHDPVACWSRPWDGQWRLVLFDVAIGNDRQRDRLRLYLRGRGFGYLQQSVWITPDPLTEEREVLTGARVDVEALLLLEARPCAGESNQEIVAGAWDFDRINQRYRRCRQVLERRPRQAPASEAERRQLRRWAEEERAAWLDAVRLDPLLPQALLPAGYLGQETWRLRTRELAAMAALCAQGECRQGRLPGPNQTST